MTAVGCRDFPATNAHYEVSSPLDPAGTGHTLLCWVDYQNQGANGYQGIDDNNLIMIQGSEFRVNVGGFTSQPPWSALNSGSWYFGGYRHDGATGGSTSEPHHMAVEENSGDKTLDDIGDTAIGQVTKTGAWWIGAAAAFGTNWPDKLAHSMFFSGAELLIDQVYELAFNPFQQLDWQDGDTVWHHPMMGQASNEPDWASNKSDGTLTGTGTPTATSDGPPIHHF